MRARIALIGAGPTGLYTLAGLVESRDPLDIVLYNKGELLGAGTPYSPEGANKLMLANIASIEIPPLTMTYLDWLKACPDALLETHGIRRSMLNERLFTPRLLLGRYLHDQLIDELEKGERCGHTIVVKHETEVLDIVETDGRFRIETADGLSMEGFDKVIIATGHDFSQDEAKRGYFPSPWSGLLDAEIPAGPVGIMGTSLSAIDAALAVVCQHGDFVRTEDGMLSYETDRDELVITMMSRNGILPEADFYCQIPYLDLEAMTDEALAACRAKENVLDGAFSLFRDELCKADPAYAMRTGLRDMTVDTYPAFYFEERMKADPFRWARHNLEEVERNKALKITVAWRYAILRMHEKVELLVPFFSEEDRKRFDSGLKRVFIDNYGAVPPESIRRLLALRDAGVLRMMRLGEDYEMEIKDRGTVIRVDGEEHVFPVFIDARGQKALTTEDIRFPSLRRVLEATGHDIPDLDRSFALRAPKEHLGRVYLAAIPFLMHDRPFVQGIVASAEIGRSIASAILGELDKERQDRLCA